MSHHRMHPYNHSPYHNSPRNQQQAQQAYEQAMENQDEPGDAPAEAVEDEAPETDAREEQAAEAAPAVDPAEEARKEIDEARLRMAAEMDNFKKRLNREFQEQSRYASEKVLSDLLPALDNLDLAIQYAPDNEACRDLATGVEMTRKQLLDAIGKHGLTQVGQEGEAFNPEIHEAIGIEQHPEYDKGAVSRVLQKGYKLNDRLLRPAKVLVNN